MKVKITVTPCGSLYYASASEADGDIISISGLYLESLWTATADGLWPETEAGLLQSISAKDI